MFQYLEIREDFSYINQMYRLLLGKNPSWNSTEQTPYELTCEEMAQKDLAFVYIDLSAESLLRTIRNTRITFAGRVAMIGELPLQAINYH